MCLLFLNSILFLLTVIRWEFLDCLVAIIKSWMRLFRGPTRDSSAALVVAVWMIIDTPDS